MLLVVCCQSVADTSSEPRPPLNRKNFRDQPHLFEITADDSGENLKRFYVGIKAKDPKVPLEVGSGYLTIQDGNSFVCGCEVKGEPNEGAVWFQFDVAPAYLEKSRFSFTVATATAEERKKLPDGGGWANYLFTLKDFVGELGVIDLEILRKADGILADESQWNRKCERRYQKEDRTWSLYTALHKASLETTGTFDHRQPALEEIRKTVQRLTADKKYQHRLMDYNNDPETQFADIKKVLTTTIERVSALVEKKVPRE
jgi:hypothetical protein